MSASVDAAHTIDLSSGGSIQLHSALTPNPYHPLQWMTSDPNVADVNAWYGVIYAHADGVATISASNGSDTEVFQVRVGAGDSHDTGDTSTTTTSDTTDTKTTSDGGGFTPGSASDLLTQLIGTNSASDVRALGGMFAQYEDNFTRYDEPQWAAYGTRWDLIDYYDRAMIYYAWHRHTGDSKYLARANALAVDYRRNYIEANGYLISPHWSMLDGIAIHYLTTGDEASRTAIGKVGDLFTGVETRNDIGNRLKTDNRIQSRYIEALLLANKLNAPSTGVAAGGISGGHDWAFELRRALPLILSTQDADGAWRLSDCGDGGPRAVHPFTTGLLMDALVRYYEMFEADPRILPAVQRAADYLWQNDWISTSRAFRYIERVCPIEGTPIPAPDLNNLIVNGYAWVYKQTGDGTYKNRADQIFAGAVAGAWLSPTKQFNQVYANSLRYLTYRR